MDSIPTTIGEQFHLLFDGGDDFVLLKKESLSGRLKHYDHVHFLAWQVLLGVLPTETTDSSGNKSWQLWEEAAKKWRKEYDDLKQELVVNPHADGEGEETIDVTNDNPLSMGESSTWAQYFANSELRKDIFRDVDRTYPEIEFFRTTEIQDLLTTILFIYAKKHPQLAYKQGMHEIGALPLYVVHRERLERLSGEHYTPDAGRHDYSKVIKTLYDPKFIEHDIYHLFSKMLEHLGPFYQQASSKAPQPAASSNLDSSLGSLTGDGDSTSNTNASAVLRKCKLIQDVYLKKHDEALSNHLSDIELEPQLYLLRWIRILFGREFHLEDTITVWDAVFAFDDRFGFIDYMACAMLIFIRSQLLGRDFADCIKRLQKYPPVEDVTILIEHSIALTKPRAPGMSGPLPFPSTLANPSTPSPPLMQPAPLVTVAKHEKSSSSGDSQHSSGHQSAPVDRSKHVQSAPPKPIVYASPVYNAQQATPVAVGKSGSSSASNHTPHSLSSQPPKKHTSNASDAQILKATPLATPPPRGSRQETQLVTVPKAEWEELNRKVADANLSQAKLLDRLGSVISQLQTSVNNSTHLPTEVSDLLLLTIAGLKRTRDVASGFLPDDDDAIPLPVITGPPSSSSNSSSSSTTNSTSAGDASLHAVRVPQPAPTRAAPVPSSSSATAAASRTVAVAPAAPVAPMTYGSSIDTLPPPDSDEWVFAPVAVTGKTAATRSGTTPTAVVDIPASSEASKAVVSSIFD